MSTLEHVINSRIGKNMMGMAAAGMRLCTDEVRLETILRVAPKEEEGRGSDQIKVYSHVRPAAATSTLLP